MRLTFFLRVVVIVWAICMLALVAGYIGTSCTASASPSSGTVVYAVGDSITAGAGTSGAWRDSYAQRAFNRICGSFCGPNANLGHSGQCLVTTYCGYGPTLLSTFPGEVYGHGVTTVLIEIGRNDLAHATDAQLEDGYLQLAYGASTHGIKALFSTIPPAGAGYQWASYTEPQRTRINQWIRAQFGTSVIDSEAVLLSGNVMWAPYDSGDHIHPGDLGAMRMADMVTLSEVQ